MGTTRIGSTPHPSAPHKLALGWATPTVVTRSGLYRLEDVRAGGDALVLPRYDRYGTEYVTIANRQNGPPGTPGSYDQQILDSGLAVWHVVDPFQLDGADRDLPPACLEGVWQSDASHPVRQGLRFLRPEMATETATTAFWSAVTGDLPDFADVAPLQCPAPANGNVGTQALRWADGTTTGYRVRDISASAETMTLVIDVPSCAERCSEFIAGAACQCDTFCATAGDCCFDADVYTFGSPPRLDRPSSLLSLFKDGFECGAPNRWSAAVGTRVGQPDTARRRSASSFDDR
jgi:hypothetical protein